MHRQLQGKAFFYRQYPAVMAAALILVSSLAHAAGISLNRTRVVFSGGEKAESLGIRNTTGHVWLVQVRVLDAEGKDDPSMVVTPPLFRLEAKGQNSVRILSTDGGKGLPENRESLKYVDVSAIPSSEKMSDASSQLVVGVGMRIKVFWRPASLSEPDKKVFSGLSWSRDGTGVRVCNGSAYYLSFNRLELDGRLMDLNRVPSMVAPGGCERYPGTGVVSHVRWSVINDYGGDSGWFTRVVEHK
ncbi:TPA: molecular chaperone [Salmonella enterica]|nr:molecular chaperone [Salmonella enterica]MCH5736149.1 molecular chaperone [Salmonella enterica]MCH5745078.1 molecular chaperone [Salmonella enterica]MCH5745872.1 molecular chaperone [Salmonella enterica]MCH5755044.1 molecular chaperone [Salmonella enterica]